MKKWQEFLLWIICFAFTDTVFEFIKTLTENGTLSKWVFPVVALLILIIGLTVTFVGAKSLKKQKKNNWVVGFIYFFIVLSVYTTFDVMKYSLENGILNTYYFFGLGTAFLFIGWSIGYLTNILPNHKKRK